MLLKDLSLHKIKTVVSDFISQIILIKKNKQTNKQKQQQKLSMTLFVQKQLGELFQLLIKHARFLFTALLVFI